MKDAWEFDPRPDLADDHANWWHLLMHARALDGGAPEGLYGALHGLRCLGARLGVVNGRARLFRGEIPERQYGALRERWLKPHHETLVRLLETHERWTSQQPGTRIPATSDDVARALP